MMSFAIFSIPHHHGQKVSYWMFSWQHWLVVKAIFLPYMLQIVMIDCFDMFGASKIFASFILFDLVIFGHCRRRFLSIENLAALVKGVTWYLTVKFSATIYRG